MNNKNLLLFVIAAFVVLAQAFTPVSMSLNNQLRGLDSNLNASIFDEIDSRFQEKLNELNIPGASLAIIDGDRIVHTKGFGSTGHGNDVPTPQTPFFIGSMTKSFTALAVMQLVEEGRIELDAPVQQYLPWFTLADPQAASRITIRHLLNQTSGFSQLPGMIGLANFDNSPDAVEAQAKTLATLEPARPAGEEFEYSNVNFNLLGLVIEKTSGTSYAQYIQNHIYEPLDMQHSYSNKSDARRDGLSIGHEMWFGFPVAVPDISVPEGSLPSGQLISSTEDISHYIIAQLNDGKYGGRQIISAEGMQEMHRPAADISPSGLGTGDYGMGWFIKSIGNTRLVFHHGEVPDFFSYMGLLPDQKRGVIILFNTNQQVYNFAMLDLGESVARQLAGETVQSDSWWIMPWALRALLLLPVFQLLIICFLYKKMSHWKIDPSSRPGKVRLWLMHVIIPAVFDLLIIGAAAAILFSGLFGFIMLFMGDITSIVLLCGLIALVWLVMRIWLVSRLPNSNPV